MTLSFEHEYLILGGGPAGLQLGYFLQKNGRDYRILEAGRKPGTFFETFPRHRKLISINKVHTGLSDPEVNLRYDWNSLLSDDPAMLFRNYSRSYFPEADVIVRYLEDFARHFGLQVETGARAARVTRDGAQGKFTVQDDQGRTWTGRRLIAATGLSKPYIPDIPGFDLVESYFDFSVNPEDYRDQRVLILGKGNSAFETADSLCETAAVIHVCSPHPVTLAWKSHFVGHLRAVNNNFLDTYQLKVQNAVVDAQVERIERREGGGYLVDLVFSHAKGQRRRIPYDRILACTGFRFDDSPFDEACRPELTIHGKFPAQTAEWESVNVPDLYFAGTVTQMRDYRRTMSGFIHGFRYNVEALSRILDLKYHGQGWPQHVLPKDPDALVDFAVRRLCRSSALFLQPGFFCDLLVIPEGASHALYYPEMTRDYVRDSAFGRNAHYYTLSLEYGHFDGDPLNVERDPDPASANQAPYLHPIIRRFAGPDLVSEHHIHDDLENDWGQEELVRPFREYLRQQMEPELSLVGV